MRISTLYRFFVSVISFILLLSVIGGIPAAAAAIFDPSSVVFREVMSGLTQPVFITNAGDGSNRLFIVERTGRIWIFADGTLLPSPFLDIHSIVNSSGSEQGLLTLAFHPNYQANGQFYIVYIDQNGSVNLARFLRSATDPNHANPNSRTILLTVPHPTFQNHNGGHSLLVRMDICIGRSETGEVEAIRRTMPKTSMFCLGKFYASMSIAPALA